MKQKKMQINDSTINRSECNHRDNIWKSLTRGLPGNHYRDLNSRITDIEEISCTLYKAIEYETTLFYDGKTYIYRAFPFGDMEIDGDVMETKDSLNKSVRKIENASYSRIEKRKETIDKNINKRITPFSLLTILLLLTSIIMSLFVLRITLMIMFFVLAVISFVLNLIFIQIAIKKENQNADKAIQVEETKVEKEILDLKKNYKVKQRELLNSKLKKLGLEPVSATELYQGEVL